MLDTVKQLGIFFKYSPKRSRRLEAAVVEVNPEDPTRDPKNLWQTDATDQCSRYFPKGIFPAVHIPPVS